MEKQAAKSKASQDFFIKKVKETIQNNNQTFGKKYGEQALLVRSNKNRYRTLALKISSVSSKLQAVHQNH